MKTMVITRVIWWLVVVGVTLCASCLLDAKTYTPLPPSVPRQQLPHNNAYEGLVFSGFSESLRPEFSWHPSLVDHGAVYYDLQYSSDEKFDDDTVTISTGENHYRPDTALQVSTVAPVGRRYYWRVRACIHGSCSEYSPTWWVNLGRSEKDYNGDGYADVLVGAADGTDPVGRVYLYFGGPGSSFDSSPDAIINGEYGSGFGDVVASAGDVNGDGFADVIVGAPNSVENTGAAFLYLGGAVGFDSVPDASFRGVDKVDEFGYAVSSVGDLNRDGFDDFCVGAYFDDTGGPSAGRVFIFYGRRNGVFDVSETIVGTKQDQLGHSLASAGDMNGDGFADLAVGALGDQNFGSVYIYLGGYEFDDVADLRVPGNVSQDFESATLVAGDFDSDGFSDLVVGVPSFMGLASGRALVYLGGRELYGVPAVIFSGEDFNEKLGYSASVGDVNGDGTDDLVLGAVVIGAAGRARLYLGSAGEALAPRPVGVLRGHLERDGYGRAVASGGDLNGDGFDDIVVAAVGESSTNSSGRVYVYFGNSEVSFESTPDGILDGPVNSGLGSSVAFK